MAQIVSIAPFKGQVAEVALSDGRSLWLHNALIYNAGLHKGDTLTEAQITELLQQAADRRAFEYGLYLLERRGYSYRELYDKLMQAERADEQATLHALEKLVRLGFLNDARYAEALARQLVEQKRYGLHRAAMEMRHRGLSAEEIDNALAPYEDPEDTAQRLMQLLERKYARRLTDPHDRKAIESVKASLIRRGFDYSDVRNAIEGYFSDEDYEEEEIDS
ncbi:MAG: RecX family transcriptional regulator [Oscillospiraceae bacterium]|nr:RecX family transcriptional regulator [Oscillospiraceae bacterium]